MVVKVLIASTLSMAAALATTVSAQDQAASTVANLALCRTISTPDDRLACFDRTSQALDGALSSGELLIVDRTQATAARRQAFGSTTAPADILQPPRAEDRIDAIETTLVRATQSGDNRWTFVLADGSIWTQTDTDRVRIVNREGEPVRVRRGALGSYLLTVGRSGVVRVRRQ